MSFEVLADKLKISPELLCKISGLAYSSRENNNLDDVMVPFKC